MKYCKKHKVNFLYNCNECDKERIMTTTTTTSDRGVL